MTSEGTEIARLRAALVDYLRRNPDAADTLEGIVTWWLPPGPVRIEEGSVERALEQLVAEGFVTRSILVEGTVLYTRSKGA